MKIIFFLVLFFMTMVARENPFEASYITPKVTENTISLLNIKTNKVFVAEQNITQAKEIKTTKIEATVLPAIQPNVKQETPKVKISPAKPISKVIKPTKKPKKIVHKKMVPAYKILYQNYFLTVLSNGQHFKIVRRIKFSKKQDTPIPIDWS